jgi:LPXTG-motif cell wall-anchored protein
MSRLTLPYKAGVVMALAAFVIGITAASAMAWPGGEPVAPTTPQHGKDKDKDKDKGHKDDDDDDEGKGGHEKPQPQPPAPSGQPSPPPPAGPAPPPVVSQGVPTPPPAAPEQPVDTETLPPEQNGVPESPVVAQTPPSAGAPTSPVADRRQLAKTGLDPALIALLGAMCLGGGGLLFRRALARN